MLQQQFNNIVEATQLTYDQIPEYFIVTVNVRSVHRQHQALTQAFSRLIREVFHSLVDRSLWQVAPDNLKRFLNFGDSFRLF